MSRPSKHPKKRKAKPATELPDDEAIRKLFPKKAVDEINRNIGHTPKSTPRKKA